jgi:uncharacterized membrane protein
MFSFIAMILVAAPAQPSTKKDLALQLDCGGIDPSGWSLTVRNKQLKFTEVGDHPEAWTVQSAEAREAKVTLRTKTRRGEKVVISVKPDSSCKTLDPTPETHEIQVLVRGNEFNGCCHPPSP